jgi:ketosteroid isomerase-like protein
VASENVELVRASVEAYNRGDYERALENATPDFEMDMMRAVGPDHGTFSRDEMMGFWTDFAENWESVHIEPLEFIEIGDQVIVPWKTHGVGRSGIEVHANVTWTFTLRDGKIARIELFQERDDALAAAG